MDNKKGLKPELKEIYERVMNTNSSSTTPKTPSPKPTPPPEPLAGTVPEKATEPFLTSSAPRPISDSSTFVFSSHGKNNTPQSAPAHTATPAPKVKEESQSHSAHADTKTQKNATKPGNIMIILIALMVIFTLIYSVFWMFYFEII